MCGTIVGMVTVRCNIHHLMALKAQRERRRISLSTVARETGISRYTLSVLASGRAKEIPVRVIIDLCTYFRCGIGDLLELATIPDELAPTD